MDELQQAEHGGSSGQVQSCVYFKHALQQMFAYKWPFLFVHRFLIIGLLRSVVAMSAQEWGICLRGKGKTGFIHYGVQLSLLPGRLPAPALIIGAADLTSPIQIGTAWYKWNPKPPGQFQDPENRGEKGWNVAHRHSQCFTPKIQSLWEYFELVLVSGFVLCVVLG